MDRGGAQACEEHLRLPGLASPDAWPYGATSLASLSRCNLIGLLICLVADQIVATGAGVPSASPYILLGGDGILYH